MRFRVAGPYLIEREVLIADEIGTIPDKSWHGSRLKNGTRQVRKILGGDVLVNRPLPNQQSRCGAPVCSIFRAVGEEVLRQTQHDMCATAGKYAFAPAFDKRRAYVPETPDKAA
jgi:hypothetical protein